MEKPWYSFLYIKSPIVKIVWGIASVLIAFVVVLAVFIMEDNRMAAQTLNWEGRSIEKGAEIYANNCYTCHGDHGQGVPGPALNSKYFFEHRLDELGFTGTLEDYVKLTVAAGRPSNSHNQFGVVMATWSSSYGGPLRNDQVQQVADYVMNWESTAILQTPEEDPFVHFNNVPVVETAPVSGTETISGTEAVSGTEAAPAAVRTPQELFGSPQAAGLGCYACHNLTLNEIPGDANNHGAIGPNMANLADHAGERVPGEDAATYVHNSIIDPGAFTVPTYIPNLMPKDFGTRMTPEELDGLVAWLLDPNKVLP